MPDPIDNLADEPFTCWCGAKGTHDELFDDSGLEATCGGTGVLNCFCGGDFCVCHHHGEVECFGCPDCEDEDDDFDPIDDPDYYGDDESEVADA